MILVDTSVWIDHFRRNDAMLERLLNEGQLLLHPFVLGELAMGNLQPPLIASAYARWTLDSRGGAA